MLVDFTRKTHLQKFVTLLKMIVGQPVKLAWVIILMWILCLVRVNVDEDDSDSEREGEGALGDDIHKFVCDAILRTVEMKDQMSYSIQNFEDLLLWGKELYLKNNVTDNATTMWPSNWEEVCTRLENIGYSSPKLYWVCLDPSHPCLYAVLENKEDCCPHCGKYGSISYYYLSVTNKVKRWCSSSSRVRK